MLHLTYTACSVISSCSVSPPNCTVLISGESLQHCTDKAQIVKPNSMHRSPGHPFFLLQSFCLISSSYFTSLLSYLRRCWLCTRAPHPHLFSNNVPSSNCWCLQIMLGKASTAHQNHETYCAFPRNFLFPQRKKGLFANPAAQ